MAHYLGQRECTLCLLKIEPIENFPIHYLLVYLEGFIISSSNGQLSPFHNVYLTILPCSSVIVSQENEWPLRVFKTKDLQIFHTTPQEFSKEKEFREFN